MLMKIVILFKEKWSHIDKFYFWYLFMNGNHILKWKVYRTFFLLGPKDYRNFFCFGGEIRKTTKRKRKVPPTSRKSYLYYGRIPPIQTQHQTLAKKYRNGQQLLRGTCCRVHFLHAYLRLEILEIYMMTFPEREMETALCPQDWALCSCLPVKTLAPSLKLLAYAY